METPASETPNDTVLSGIGWATRLLLALVVCAETFREAIMAKANRPDLQSLFNLKIVDLIFMILLIDFKWLTRHKTGN